LFREEIAKTGWGSTIASCKTDEENKFSFDCSKFLFKFKIHNKNSGSNYNII